MPTSFTDITFQLYFSHGFIIYFLVYKFCYITNRKVYILISILLLGMVTVNLGRKARAQQILLEKGVPKAISEKEFLVPSQRSERKYIVNNFFGWACECLDFRSGHKYCKHILAVKIWLKSDSKKNIEYQEETIEKEICVKCKSTNLVKNGKKRTKIEIKQRFKCKDCAEVLHFSI